MSKSKPIRIPVFFERILQYWADMYSSQLNRGDDYVKLCPVRLIVITEFPVFPQLKELHTVFEVRARENPAVLLSEHFQIHFLRLGNLLKKEMQGLESLTDDLQRWLEFWSLDSELLEGKMSAMTEEKLLELLQGSPVLAAYQEYKRFCADPVMRERERERQRFLRDQRLDKAYAYDEGKEEGLAEGEALRSVAIARNMKAMGLSTAVIAQVTGLSAAEIEQLQ